MSKRAAVPLQIKESHLAPPISHGNRSADQLRAGDFALPAIPRPEAPQQFVEDRPHRWRINLIRQ